MRYIFTFIFLFLSTGMYAQKNTKAHYKRNWGNYVFVQPDYSYRRIGNIIDPKAIVVNSLPYNITNVRILGTYYSSTGNILKTVISAPFNVAAHEKVVINFPNLNRGVRFDTMIVQIDCKIIGLMYLCTECIDPN